MTEDWKGTRYLLRSLLTGREFEDEGWTLDAPGEAEPALIRAIYEHKQLRLGDEGLGLYRFVDWLPVRRILKGSSPPVTYKSKGLAKELGLSALYITFSGYWPEIGANMNTCSFKETEAYSVCGRMDGTMDRILVVASAGNTARSFARVCSDNGIPLLLSVPEDNIGSLWFDEEIRPNVRLICSRSGGDYFDAIHLSNIACRSPHFIAEGGARNVARRDGMGTTVLSAVTTIGTIPDYYFQAVGSGTGAIAAWEANLRFLEDGRFGNKRMKLMVSQNEPFRPIADAWHAGSRQMLPLDDNLARKHVETIIAKVLSNRKPPYSIIGGLFDALSDTGGTVLTATNEEARSAAEMFLHLEGNDLHPAAAVATASLLQAVQKDMVKKDAIVMLNITGGGEEKFKSEKKLHYLKPSIVFDLDPDPDNVLEKIEQLSFKA
jgi:cysteate synthase